MLKRFFSLFRNLYSTNTLVPTYSHGYELISTKNQHASLNLNYVFVSSRNSGQKPISDVVFKTF